MEQYKYQMHVHTTPCSHCGLMTPYELCKGLHDMGYKGAVLTNHFFHGNTGIDRSLPWEEFVKAYEKDYKDCLEASKEFDLDILFGIEEVVVPGLEILCYGLTPKILYNNPHLRDCDTEAWVETMRKNGVVLVQAHPFREAFYIPNPGPLPLRLIDGVEIYNRGNGTPEMNEATLQLAEENPLLIRLSGADAHCIEHIPYGGIVTKKRIRNEKALAEALKNKQFEPIIP
ncbi:MAG: PHP domain-containing protein [Clostridia bacterium]|nr:PHP domain-containing protein [Clostridia bacterium]